MGTLLSVAEFSRLPQPAGGIRQELHHGALVCLPPVKKLHTKIQKRLVDLLAAVVSSDERGVDKEFPFRPAPEYEVWVADVAIFSVALWEQTADDDYFNGVPEVVIEVLSSSNTDPEMTEREDVCLRHGGREFCLVDPERASVKVVRAGGYSTKHDAEGVIESSALRQPIAVRDIFSC